MKKIITYIHNLGGTLWDSVTFFYFILKFILLRYLIILRRLQWSSYVSVESYCIQQAEMGRSEALTGTEESHCSLQLSRRPNLGFGSAIIINSTFHATRSTFTLMRVPSLQKKQWTRFSCRFFSSSEVNLNQILLENLCTSHSLKLVGERSEFCNVAIGAFHVHS